MSLSRQNRRLRAGDRRGGAERKRTVHRVGKVDGRLSDLWVSGVLMRVQRDPRGDNKGV
jgi:hypothetical protein